MLVRCRGGELYDVESNEVLPAADGVPVVNLGVDVDAVRAARWARPHMARALAVAALPETVCELLFPPEESEEPGRRMASSARRLRRIGLQVHPEVAALLVSRGLGARACEAAARQCHRGDPRLQRLAAIGAIAGASKRSEAAAAAAQVPRGGVAPPVARPAPGTKAHGPGTKAHGPAHGPGTKAHGPARGPGTMVPPAHGPGTMVPPARPATSPRGAHLRLVSRAPGSVLKECVDYPALILAAVEQKLLKSARAIFAETGGNKRAVFAAVKLLVEGGHLMTDAAGVYRRADVAGHGEGRRNASERNGRPSGPGLKRSDPPGPPSQRAS